MRAKLEVRRTNDEVRATRLAFVFTVCLSLLPILGCESGVEQYQPEPNVYCVLRTDETAVSLLAGMTASYFDSVPDTNEWQGTAGVTVAITHAGTEAVLREVTDPVGYYQAESLAVTPGDSYSISLIYPGGIKVNGTTVVPDTFGIDSLRVDTTLEVPWPGDTSVSINIASFWRQSRGATGYVCLLDVHYRSGGDSARFRWGPFLTTALHDFETVQPAWYGWDSITGTPDSMPLERVEIEVKAADRNFYDYAMLAFAGQVNPNDMHLDGGLGVFGSACVIDSTIWLQRRVLPAGPASDDYGMGAGSLPVLSDARCEVQ
jgi:hypothetical protein